MRHPQFYISGKRPIPGELGADINSRLLVAVPFSLLAMAARLEDMRFSAWKTWSTNSKSETFKLASLLFYSLVCMRNTLYPARLWKARCMQRTRNHEHFVSEIDLFKWCVCNSLREYILNITVTVTGSKKLNQYQVSDDYINDDYLAFYIMTIN